jgi:AcrR family transcriptional regulator
MPPPRSPRRPYRSLRRQAQAQATERRIVDAMVELVVADGWAATTMRGIAQRAGVSEQLLYKRFGTKVALAKRAYDVTLVGDQEPVPLSERGPVVRIKGEPDLAGKVARYAEMAGAIMERVGPFLDRLIAGAQAGAPELAALVDLLDQQRVAGVRSFVGHLDEAGALPAGVGRDLAADIVWTLVSPATFAALGRRGWSNEDVQRWLAGVVPTALERGTA